VYPQVGVVSGSCRAVGQAGGVLLTRTVDVTGLGKALSAGLARWRKPFAVHDPGKIITDLAVSLALGGDCLADVALIRSEPGVFGRVASDPTISRLVARLAMDAPAALKAIGAARSQARAQAWRLAGGRSPGHGASPAAPLIIDVDATLVTAHSDKEQAAATFKRGYGFHPLCGFVDHGPDGTGELLAIQLRPGNAGSNTAADHIKVVREAFGQVPGLTGRRLHPRSAELAGRPAGPVLDRLDPAQRRQRTDRTDPGPVLGPGLGRRRRTTRWGVGDRTDRAAQPCRLAGRDAGHRPQGKTPPRRPN
jgi:hypothetical protein